MSGPMVMFNPYVLHVSQIDSCAEQSREGNKHAFDVMRALDCWTRLAKGTRLEKCFVCDTCTSDGNLGGWIVCLFRGLGHDGKASATVFCESCGDDHDEEELLAKAKEGMGAIETGEIYTGSGKKESALLYTTDITNKAVH